MTTKTDPILEYLEVINSSLFQEVKLFLHEALIVAWDGCHKIYIGMDEQELEWLRENYASTDNSTSQTFEGSVGEMLQMVATWWTQSCPLRFIYAVYTNEENPNEGFVSVIEQGAYEEEEEDDDDYDEDEES